MEQTKILRGYERRLFLKEDLCERFDIVKGQSFELGYKAHGKIAVMFPKDSSFLEVKEMLDRLRDNMKDRIEAENVYQSI